MAAVLLTSEKFVKSVTNISDNIAGKYLESSIREAQDVKLRGILGDCLFSHLKTMVGDNSIKSPERIHYKELLDHAQYFLAYSAIVELTNKVSYKIVNFGVTKTSDENMQVASADEISSQRFFYQSKADAYCLDLQRWIIANREFFPDLDTCSCQRMSSNLRSSVTCGIVLGGPRGKMKRR